MADNFIKKMVKAIDDYEDLHAGESLRSTRHDTGLPGEHWRVADQGFMQVRIHSTPKGHYPMGIRVLTASCVKCKKVAPATIIMSEDEGFTWADKFARSHAHV